MSERDRSRSPAPRGGSPPRARARSRSPDRGPDRSSAGSGKILTGKAGRWNDRGFCFISPDSGEEDIFCHFSAITDGNTLADGAKVEFEKEWDDRKGKYRAENVTGGHTEERRARPPARDAGECYAFRDGNCTRGSSCRFSHEGGGRGGGRDGGRDYRDSGRDYRDDRGGYGGDRGGYGGDRGGYGGDRGGYSDRGGGYDSRGGGGYDRYEQRGGYDDRGGGYESRGGYDDRRGGGRDDRAPRYDDRGGSRGGGGYDRYSQQSSSGGYGGSGGQDRYRERY